jgi:gamma-glutamyl:cysteine ligase YbdK (ATP-grasp superfamily)
LYGTSLAEYAIADAAEIMRKAVKFAHACCETITALAADVRVCEGRVMDESDNRRLQPQARLTHGLNRSAQLEFSPSVLVFFRFANPIWHFS